MESDNDKSLAFNSFTDSCSELTKKQLQRMKGFVYADKKKKLPLPWPTVLSTTDSVPETNPLNGRWETVSGGDAEFINKSIAIGMLGSAEASNIQADVDTEWRSVQSRCFAKVVRAVRTWKSGHYFYESLVSGSHLFGVCVLLEDYRILGDVFRKNVSAFSAMPSSTVDTCSCVSLRKLLE